MRRRRTRSWWGAPGRGAVVELSFARPVSLFGMPRAGSGGCRYPITDCRGQLSLRKAYRAIDESHVRPKSCQGPFGGSI